MSPITIDLNREPELKDLLADKQPGDKIDLHCSIKSIDDQTAVMTFEEASAGAASDDESTEAAPDTEPKVPAGMAVNEGGNGGQLAAALES